LNWKPTKPALRTKLEFDSFARAMAGVLIAACFECPRQPRVGCLCVPAPVFTIFLPGTMAGVLSEWWYHALFNPNPVLLLMLSIITLVATIPLLVCMVVMVPLGFLLDLAVWISWLVSCGFCLVCCPCKETKSKRWDSCGCCMLKLPANDNWEACACGGFLYHTAHCDVIKEEWKKADV